MAVQPDAFSQEEGEGGDSISGAERMCKSNSDLLSLPDGQVIPKIQLFNSKYKLQPHLVTLVRLRGHRIF